MWYLRIFFGNNISKPKETNVMMPTIEIIPSDMEIPEAPSWAARINELLHDEEYQHFIASVALVYEARGHKVLVTGTRVKFLENCAKLCGDSAISITGETKDRDGLINEILIGNKNILFSYHQISFRGGFNK